MVIAVHIFNHECYHRLPFNSGLTSITKLLILRGGLFLGKAKLERVDENWEIACNKKRGYLGREVVFDQEWKD